MANSYFAGGGVNPGPDPNADRIVFWDDSATAYAFLTAGSGLSISGTTMTATGLGGDVVGPASSTDNNVAFYDSTTGKLLKNNATSLGYNATLVNTLPGLSAAIPILMLASRATSSGAYVGIEARVTNTAPSDLAGSLLNTTGIKANIDNTGTFSWAYITACDIYAKNNSSGALTTLLASSNWAKQEVGSTVSNIFGSIHIAQQGHASATSTNMFALFVNPADDGAFTQLGTTTNFHGIDIRGMNLGSMTTANRVAVRIDAMTGTPSTTDFAIYSLATQPSRLTGYLGIGKTPATWLDIVTTAPGTYTTVLTATGYTTTTAIKSTLTAKAGTNNYAGMVVDTVSNATTIAAGAYSINGLSANATIANTDSAAYPATSSLIGMSAVGGYAGAAGGDMPDVIGVKAIGLHLNAGGTDGVVSRLLAGGQFNIVNTEGSGTTPIAAALHVLRPVNSTGQTWTLSAGLYLENQTPTGGTNSAPYGIYQVTGTGLMNYLGSPLGLGAGLVTPTALLHLAAGTATASTGPLKFSSGTNLGTAEAGCMEYDGTSLFFTRTGTTRSNIICASSVATEVIVSDTSLTINYGGVAYKLLARA